VFVNMVVFSEEDRVLLIKNLYELKGCGAKQTTEAFHTKGWKIKMLNNC